MKDNLKRLLKGADLSSFRYNSSGHEPKRFGSRKIQEQYPVMGIGDEVAEVVQSNFGITDLRDQRPIIATSALFTCIGLLGYDREHNIGFLMHIQPSNSVQMGFERLYQELAVRYPDSEKVFDTQIVASTFHYFQIYRDLEDALRDNASGIGTRLNPSYPIEFSLDMKREGKPGEGIALDTRTGKIYAFLRDTVREGPCDFKYNKPIPEKRSFGMTRFS